jgi:DNA-binding transcriptional LysR family regulator
MNKTSLTATESLPDWNLLATWVAVIESGSVSAAAKLLGISQAAVSQRLKLLEAAVGTDLLDRATRPARATPAGELLMEHASKLLLQAGEMTESVRNLSRAKRHTVRFGCVDSFAATLGPTLIRGLSGATRQIRLWSGITPILDGQMESRQLDVAVTTSAALGKPSIRKYSLFSEPYLLVMPKGFDLGNARTVSDLAQRSQFIRYSARSVIGQDIDNYLESMGQAIERTYEFDNTDPLLSLVSAGLGFALSTPLCIWQSRHFIAQLDIYPMSVLAGIAAGRGMPAARTFYLAYRDRELGKLPQEARDVILIGVERLITRELAPALKLPADSLWIASRR